MTFQLEPDFRLVEPIATGGTGEVWLALEVLGARRRWLVLKRPRPDRVDEPGFRERFFKEVDATRAMVHPNLVRVRSVWPHPSRPILALKYIHGVSLRELVVLQQESGHRLVAGVALALALQVASGLAAVHEVPRSAGAEARRTCWVHRDLSPFNVLVDERANVKIIDFGLSLLEGETDPRALGSAPFASPEQRAGAPADRRSDLYSLAAVLLELFLGRPLRTQDHPGQLVEELAGPPHPVPSEVCNWLRRALQVDPNLRPRAAGELVELIRSAAYRKQLRMDRERAVRHLFPLVHPVLEARRLQMESKAQQDLLEWRQMDAAHPAAPSDTMELLDLDEDDEEEPRPARSPPRAAPAVAPRVATLLLGVSTGLAIAMGVALTSRGIPPSPAYPPAPLAPSPLVLVVPPGWQAEGLRQHLALRLDQPVALHHASSLTWDGDQTVVAALPERDIPTGATRLARLGDHLVVLGPAGPPELAPSLTAALLSFDPALDASGSDEPRFQPALAAP